MRKIYITCFIISLFLSDFNSLAQSNDSIKVKPYMAFEMSTGISKIMYPNSVMELIKTEYASCFFEGDYSGSILDLYPISLKTSVVFKRSEIFLEYSRELISNFSYPFQEKYIAEGGPGGECNIKRIPWSVKNLLLGVEVYFLIRHRFNLGASAGIGIGSIARPLLSAGIHSEIKLNNKISGILNLGATWNNRIERYNRYYDGNVVNMTFNAGARFNFSEREGIDTAKTKFMIFWGSIFYLNKDYYAHDGYSAYPYFGNNELSKSLQYKNALSTINILVPLMELNFSKSKKHYHGIGIGYKKSRYLGAADGPFWEQSMNMKEFHLFYQYYYCPFHNSEFLFIKKIYIGTKVLYAIKEINYGASSNSGPPGTYRTFYHENNHAGIFQFTTGYLSSGKVIIDFGLDLNLTGLTYANYDFYYEYTSSGGLPLSYEISVKDKYSKIFYFENVFYNLEFKIGFCL